MAKFYVRMPLGKKYNFPKSCPFTGAANPKKTVTVKHPRFKWKMPIPILGSLLVQPTTRVRFPAAPSKVNIELGIKIMLGVVLAFFGVMYIYGHLQEATTSDMQRATAHLSQRGDSSLEKVMLAALVIYFIGKILSIINLRAVQIVDREEGMIEVCFNREDYAREFSTRNEFRCHELPFKKRQARRE